MCGYIEYEETSAIRQSAAQLPNVFSKLLPRSSKRYYPAFGAYKPIGIINQEASINLLRLNVGLIQRFHSW